MKKLIHKSEDRGHADHGWLNARHSFSFASYFDKNHLQFGALRVLNDDIITPSMGFGAHPHDNMEIVTIPLSGSIKHRDNTGTEEVIKTGDVQIMSAGTGIIHSEFNASHAEKLNLLQIWVFPKVEDIKPRYEQKTFDVLERSNKFQIVVSPNKEEGGVWINQDSWFSLGAFDKDAATSYTVHQPGNGVYFFLISGSATIAGETLNHRDAIGISDFENADITFGEGSELLAIEVPMTV